jgi:hypothetical protein
MTRITPWRWALTVLRKSWKLKNLKDVAELNADFQNREYHLAQLQKLSVEDVKLEPFKYQLSPSLPVKKDGPGKLVIALLAGIVGGLFACGYVLVQNAMLMRKPLARISSGTECIKKAVVTPPFLLQKIFAHRRKGIKQCAGFQAHAAMHNVRLFVERIARRHDMFFIANGEFELAGKHIG